MHCFLYALGIFGVSADRLFEIADEEQERLQTLVNDGIQSGAVRPLKRKILTGPNTGEEALEALAASIQGKNAQKVVLALEGEREKKQLNWANETQKFYFDSNKSYLIVGGRSGSWLDLAEWLVTRGVQRLTVVVEKHSMSGSVSRKFNNLLNRFPTTTIHMASVSKADSELEAQQLLKEATAFAPLGAVFFLKLRNTSNKLQNIHKAMDKLSIKAHFISIFSGGVEECILRKKNNQPSLCVLPDSTILPETSRLLSVLDKLLIKIDQNLNDSPVITFHEHHFRENMNDLEKAELHWSWHLPGSSDDLVQFRSNLAETPVFHEVTTQCPKFEDVKGIVPIFIIPGLNWMCLKDLIKNLYHPTFMAKLPLTMESIEETAEQLVKNMKKIHDASEYTLIGDSWGGALTLQIAYLLESEGKKVIVSLLDAAPETTLKWVQSLFIESPGPNKLLSRFWILNDEAKQLGAVNNLDAQLDHLLQTESEPRKLCLKESFVALFSLIKCMLKYKCPPSKIQNTIMLYRCKGSLEKDLCGLEQISDSFPSVHISEESIYKNMISCRSTLEIINREAGYESCSTDHSIETLLDQGIDTLEAQFK